MSPQNVTILIIDDDAVLRSLIGSVLRQEGYTVVGDAPSAESGLKVFDATPTDLVLLDINLPGMDGMSLLPELLAKPNAPKVIMVSGEATLDKVKGALSAGASGFVVKPISANKLLSAVSFAISGK
ncbi:response regulator [Leeia sp. TBRC 13508]|uniref:Response regulator n=1 Tax=Leeia speluncae TaxID=2884804 RepID=A0ABS8D5Y3_9NEIS|nr:response regulator [Leeia speluncae]MCB6183614.1 response regulator [Leeia speluncae]